VGFPCDSHFVSRQTARQESWEDSGPELATWLSSLSRPTGLMIASDQLGPHCLEACRSNGIIVPDDIGVVGVDNDEPLCEVSDPPLSSVWPNHRQVGYEAARLLDAMMRQSPRAKTPILLPPKGVHARGSTDSLAVDDRNVAQSLRFIREHACEDIEVNDVVRTVPISRTVLQRLFRDLLGRSIHDEIIRVRLGRARQWLQETELPLVEIAERAGFRHQEYMGAVFRLRLGITPGTIRARKKSGVPGI
jgi:LacI family transcriptional regulator